MHFLTFSEIFCFFFEISENFRVCQNMSDTTFGSIHNISQYWPPSSGRTTRIAQLETRYTRGRWNLEQIWEPWSGFSTHCIIQVWQIQLDALTLLVMVPQRKGTSQDAKYKSNNITFSWWTIWWTSLRPTCHLLLTHMSSQRPPTRMTNTIATGPGPL